MNEILDPVSTTETLDAAPELDALDIVEFGDAIEETKHTFPIPVIADNENTIGWA